MTIEEALLAVDLQPSFSPPDWLVSRVDELSRRIHTVATVERHDESATPFRTQLGWAPAPKDACLLDGPRIFVKHGYLPPPQMVEYLKAVGVKRVFVCGLQAETCVLAARFALFDAGLRPTLVSDLVVGSSIDPSGALGERLWRHHFGAVSSSREIGVAARRD